MDSGPQMPSAMPHSASRVAGNTRAQVPVVPVAPPLLFSPSQTALPSLLPSRLISSRTRRRLRPLWITSSIDRTLLSDQPPPRENCARLGAPRFLRLCPSPASTQFLLCLFNAPQMLWPHLLRPCLVPSLQKHLGVPAPPALPAMPSPAEVEFFKSVE